MTEILVLSSKNYPENETINYGDCILIHTDTDLVIYDCGHERHATEVLSYMERHNITSAKIILSHNVMLRRKNKRCYEKTKKKNVMMYKNEWMLVKTMTDEIRE